MVRIIDGFLCLMLSAWLFGAIMPLRHRQSILVQNIALSLFQGCGPDPRNAIRSKLNSLACGKAGVAFMGDFVI
jgi:hypothetical protein